MDRRRISILMPVYNGRKFIASAIESILNQAYGDFEFIIIDDASSDDSFEIVKSFKDKRIRHFRNEFNLGQTKTLNKAVKLSRGEFIARMDQDDIALKARLKDQIKFLLRYTDVSVLGTSVNIINEIGKKIGIWRAPKDEQQFKFEALFNNPIAHSSVMLRKNALLSCNAYNEEFIFGQDYELWSRMLNLRIKMINIDSPLLSLRIHRDSASVKFNSSRFNLETSLIIQRNVCTLTGIIISIEVAQNICRALYTPDALSAHEFEYICGIFDRIFTQFLYAKPLASKKLYKTMANFKYILALGYIAQDNIAMARVRFLDSFKTYPLSPYPLLSYFIAMFGAKACTQARLLKKRAYV